MSPRRAERWRRSRSLRTAALAAVGGVAILAAGCGPATNSLNPGQEEIGVAKKGPLGAVLVDDEGQTLYVFEKDRKNESTCYDACASVWPPVATAGKPKAKGAVSASKLGTTKRDDGSTQVTYNGHPLYYYQADTDSDDAYGQGVDQFGAPWFVQSASGSIVTKKVSGSGS
jgi:predicted lipoprotein with Yx(FWY)xxD motif